MTYDAERHEIVLFAGVDPSGQPATTGLTLIAQTWVFDRCGWQQKHPVHSPSPRRGAGIAYDAATKAVVLYGGDPPPSEGPISLNDTWTWDGNDWTQQHPSSNPSTGSGGQLLYVGSTQTVLLLLTPMMEPAQEWSWDGSNWTRLPDPPSYITARPTAAYDETHANVVAFGNCIVSPANPPTYLMSNGSWREVASGAIPIRCGPAMTYDGTTGNVLLFGGFDGGYNGGMYNATWLWNGSTWTKQNTKHDPSPRYFSAAVYWPDGNRVVLIGGWGEGANSEFVNLSDTWFWNGQDWSQTP